MRAFVKLAVYNQHWYSSDGVEGSHALWKFGVIREKRFFGQSIHYCGGEEGRYIELSLEKGRLWFVVCAHVCTKGKEGDWIEACTESSRRREGMGM